MSNYQSEPWVNEGGGLRPPTQPIPSAGTHDRGGSWDYVQPPSLPPMVEKKKRSWLLPGIIGAILGISIGAVASGGDSDPLPPMADPITTVTRTVNAGTPAPPVTVTKTVTAPAAVADPAPATGDTCADAREAILTGSQAQIDKALKALIADRKADQTAREAAQDYFEEDDKTLKDMNIDLVQIACQL